MENIFIMQSRFDNFIRKVSSRGVLYTNDNRKFLENVFPNPMITELKETKETANFFYLSIENIRKTRLKEIISLTLSHNVCWQDF